MRSGITSRFVMLIATAAIAPLVIYGVVSMKQLRNGTEESVTKGNLGIATQAAAQINQYVENNQRVLRSIAMELRTDGLEAWQQSRILKDTVLDFPEFRELSIFDGAGRPLGTSRFGPPTVTIPDREKAARPRRLCRAAQAGQRRAADHDDRRAAGAERR